MESFRHCGLEHVFSTVNIKRRNKNKVEKVRLINCSSYTVLLILIWKFPNKCIHFIHKQSTSPPPLVGGSSDVSSLAGVSVPTLPWPKHLSALSQQRTLYAPLRCEVSQVVHYFIYSAGYVSQWYKHVAFKVDYSIHAVRSFICVCVCVRMYVCTK